MRREQHPRYHRLIEAFEEITGLPLVLNTSSNRHGIATITAPRQALEHTKEPACDPLTHRSRQGTRPVLRWSFSCAKS